MKIFKFLPPYQSNGKTRFPEAQGRAGVYLIKENNVLVYVGESGYNIYKTLYRHFQSWNHRSQRVTTYRGSMQRNKYTVRIVFCTPKQASALEKALILKHKPRDNEQKYLNYELNFYDKETVKTYVNTAIEEDCSF